MSVSYTEKTCGVFDENLIYGYFFIVWDAESNDGYLDRTTESRIVLVAFGERSIGVGWRRLGW